MIIFFLSFGEWYKNGLSLGFSQPGVISCSVVQWHSRGNLCITLLKITSALVSTASLAASPQILLCSLLLGTSASLATGYICRLLLASRHYSITCHGILLCCLPDDSKVNRPWHEWLSCFSVGSWVGWQLPVFDSMIHSVFFNECSKND